MPICGRRDDRSGAGLRADRADPADAHRGLAGVPRQARRCTQPAWRRPSARFERIYTGGAPVFPAMLDAIARRGAERVGRRRLRIDGGRADRGDRSAGHQRRRPRRDDAGRGLLAGRPASSIQLRILPDRWGTPLGPWTSDRSRTRLARRPDQVGEIVVTGEHVLRGYLDGHRRRGDEDQGGRRACGTAPATRGISMRRAASGCWDAARRRRATAAACCIRSPSSVRPAMSKASSARRSRCTGVSASLPPRSTATRRRCARAWSRAWRGRSSRRSSSCRRSRWIGGTTRKWNTRARTGAGPRASALDRAA